jgi:hypothetical protein
MRELPFIEGVAWEGEEMIGIVGVAAVELRPAHL